MERIEFFTHKNIFKMEIELKYSAASTVKKINTNNQNSMIELSSKRVCDKCGREDKELNHEKPLSRKFKEVSQAVSPQ